MARLAVDNNGVWDEPGEHALHPAAALRHHKFNSVRTPVWEPSCAQSN